MAKICKQCRATTEDKVGKLAEVTGKVKAAGINIQGLVAWVEGDTGHLLLLADDAEKACQAVQDSGVKSCDSDEVVCVQVANQPGALNAVAGKLADAGIGIDLVYATAAEGGQATIVLRTSDNAKAAELI
jgi:hypothetical protein